MISASNQGGLDHGAESISVAEVLAEIRQRWRIPLVLLILPIIGALALSLLLRPLYQAGVIVREAEMQHQGLAGALRGNLGGLASLVGMDIAGLSRTNDAVATLKSNELAEVFIRDRKLEEELLNGDSRHSGLWYAAKKFRRSVLRVHEDRRTSLVTISVKWRDPVKAADWANGVVDLANQMLRERDRTDAERSLKFLNDRVSSTDVVEMRSMLFELIEGETRKLMLADARKDYALVVIDRAVAPEERVSPRRKLIVLAGGALGFAFASIYVLARLSCLRRN